MPTTAWRFAGTEGADGAVVRLKQLDDADMINVMDIAVLRWPEYAPAPITQEHVTQHGGAMSKLMHKLRHAKIDDTMIETVKGDMSPGTSAMVLLSSDAKIDAVVHAFEGHPMELVRTDLSIPDQDRLRLTANQIRHRDGGDAPS
jgi:uncharacterized membrane protein